MANIIKLKRGLEQNLNSNLLQDGELAITTDENNLYSSKGKINRQNVFVGSSEPDDPNIDVWINPQGSDYIVDKIYPIGSIYLSVNNTSPSVLFGGEWEQIKDRFLLGCGDTFVNGVVGGEKDHILTLEEMPNHSHSYEAYIDMNPVGGYDKVIVYGNPQGTAYYTFDVSGVGGSVPHNNLPPYLAVYIWKRIK